jgi:hypothetical protein
MIVMVSLSVLSINSVKYFYQRAAEKNNSFTHALMRSAVDRGEIRAANLHQYTNVAAQVEKMRR